jgi:hypothetical protein
MMRKFRKPNWRWTPEHDDVLVTGLKDGLSYRRIAEQIGCSRYQVGDRAKELGLAKSETRFKWTPERDALLIAAIQSRRTYAGIAADFGTSSESVRFRANTLGCLTNRSKKKAEAVSAVDGEWGALQLASMNDAFVAAMRKAVKLGREHVFEGIDKRPCTTNPIFVPAESIVPRMSAGAEWIVTA